MAEKEGKEPFFRFAICKTKKSVRLASVFLTERRGYPEASCEQPAAHRAAVSRRVKNLFAIYKTKKSVRLASRYKCNIPKVFAHIGLINPSKQHMRTDFGSECRILRSVRSGSGRYKVILCRPENAADSSKDIADAETVRRAKRAKRKCKLRATCRTCAAVSRGVKNFLQYAKRKNRFVSAETVRRAERADFIMTRSIVRHHSSSGIGCPYNNKSKHAISIHIVS